MRKTIFSILTLVLMAVQVSTLPRNQEAAIFDRFENIYCDDEKARLDNYAIQLQNQPNAIGYIVFYGGRQYGAPGRLRLPRRNEAAARASRLKSYLLSPSRDLNPARIVLVDGGFRETWQAELWIVPAGTNLPAPTPTLKPEQIKFRKGIAREKDYRCEV